MMTVLSCITGQHNPGLTLLAVVVCLTGVWTTISLFMRAQAAQGVLRVGWNLLAAVAGGSSIWCTHFISMLAYDPGVPVTVGPLLTVASLLIAIFGAFAAFTLTCGGFGKFSAIIGGAMLGMVISAMHYVGMLAYRVEGLVEWHGGFVLASVLLSSFFGALSFEMLRRGKPKYDMALATFFLVLAILVLHFTGMTAFRVIPLDLNGNGIDGAAMDMMALAIAMVCFIVIGSGLVSYLIDYQTRFDSVQQLRHMALNDALTGLPNRASFHDHLERELEHVRQFGSQLAVVGINLDRFKAINDLHGHVVGDAVLRTVAQRLARISEQDEFIARTGGDEFAAILRFEQKSKLMAFLGRLEGLLQMQLRFGELDCDVSASVGVAICPRDGAEQDTLVNNADLALQRAKSDSAICLCFYDRSMDEALRERRMLIKDLRKACQNGELELHYQVQTSVPSGDIIGYEALLRWRHPVRGVISPAEFVPLAEESGLILPIGEWALRQACSEAAEWQTPYKVAVNLSSMQFAHADLARLVHEVLLETGLPADRLELELTETTIIRDKKRSLHILRQIKGLGVSVALDDFGIGYSSLETLRIFPFDKIKLDRSFIKDVNSSPQSKAIIRAVLALGKSLGIPVLAEGIEKRSQLQALAAEGCDQAQGYYLGYPLPPAEIPGLGANADRPGNASILSTPYSNGRLAKIR